MKANKGFMQMLLVGAFAFLTFSLSSCSKQDFDGVTAKSNETAQEQLLKRVKSLKYNFKTSNGATTISSTGNGSVNFKTGDNTISFTTGNGPSTFANEQGSTNYTQEQNSTTYNSGAAPSSSYELKGTLSSGGGSMVVDGKNIQLDYIFCADAAEIFGGLTGFDGEDFNIVIGISGEFTDPETARLNHMVFMVTVGDGSSGAYKLDLGLLDEEETPSGKFGIIEVLDFSKLKQDGSLENIEDASLYVSTKGDLNASSGTYSFSLINMAELKFTQDGDLDLGKIVKASGNLLCQ